MPRFLQWCSFHLSYRFVRIAKTTFQFSRTGQNEVCDFNHLRAAKRRKNAAHGVSRGRWEKRRGPAGRKSRAHFSPRGSAACFRSYLAHAGATRRVRPHQPLLDQRPPIPSAPDFRQHRSCALRPDSAPARRPRPYSCLPRPPISDGPAGCISWRPHWRSPA